MTNTPTPKEALHVLFQSAKLARMTFDDHQLVAVSYKVLLDEIESKDKKNDTKDILG